MRYQAGHKEQTREEIVQAASRHFRLSGVKGIAIADLMRELRLTHGGFYRHFKSKEQLFLEALKKAFDEGSTMLIDAAEDAPKGQELKAIIEKYLSVGHCENSAVGCPVAALGSEISRHPKFVRTVFDEALEYGISKIAQYVPSKTNKERRRKALALFSGMAGALSLARVVNNKKLRDGILKSARETYIKAFCSE